MHKSSRTMSKSASVLHRGESASAPPCAVLTANGLQYTKTVFGFGMRSEKSSVPTLQCIFYGFSTTYSLAAVPNWIPENDKRERENSRERSRRLRLKYDENSGWMLTRASVIEVHRGDIVGRGGRRDREKGRSDGRARAYLSSHLWRLADQECERPAAH